jgi:small conductance mechanosensitive channel
MNNSYEIIWQKSIAFATTYGPNLLLAIATLFIGFKVVKILKKIADKAMEMQKVDVSLRGFIGSLISIGLKLLIIVSVASMIGIATTSFVAIIGAAGLAVGLALQGSLANFAGGVLILLFKPFKVGDYIHAQGHHGRVKEIQIFSTLLTTRDNRTIIVPNGNLSNGDIINVSKEPVRRVDMVIGIGYDDDIKQARKVMLELAKNHPKVIDQPLPFVGVESLGDSSVNLAFHVWVKQGNFLEVRFDLTEQIKEAFDSNDISFPYPQQDVHMHTVSSEK